MRTYHKNEYTVSLNSGSRHMETSTPHQSVFRGKKQHDVSRQYRLYNYIL